MVWFGLLIKNENQNTFPSSLESIPEGSGCRNIQLYKMCCLFSLVLCCLKMAKKRKKQMIIQQIKYIIMKCVKVDEVYACLPGIETNTNESVFFNFSVRQKSKKGKRLGSFLFLFIQDRAQSNLSATAKSTKHVRFHIKKLESDVC